MARADQAFNRLPVTFNRLPVKRIPPVKLSITHKISIDQGAYRLSVRRDGPRHMTVLPGGGSLARA
ncbi:hypothetical protein [Bradyrhizobium sp. 15]|uniref:hypothetical protein n=1 Tax=Bradyrhizobium sp. 15 TaxID=2782633 RepID=UPI001FF72B54|nr:hypothetical protein [Bradyrhizobium sp. 15]MCK1440577.1 hypothetical protein [Bradyrhizobium sp. 15]